MTDANASYASVAVGRHVTVEQKHTSRFAGVQFTGVPPADSHDTTCSLSFPLPFPSLLHPASCLTVIREYYPGKNFGNKDAFVFIAVFTSYSWSYILNFVLLCCYRRDVFISSHYLTYVCPFPEDFDEICLHESFECGHVVRLLHFVQRA